MTNTPRKHHYIPQFYLAGFTNCCSKDGELYVLDQQQRRSWKSTPKKTAHKRDFHAVNPGPEGDRMVVERELAKLEGRWSRVLASVIENRSLPEDDDSFGDLMIFVAMMAVRVPRIRGITSDAIDSLAKAGIQTLLATQSGRESFRKTLEDLGHELLDDEFESLVQFGQSDDYDVNLEQTWHVGQIIRTAATLAPHLSLRKWCLWTAEESAPDLICSDSPIAPTWAVPMPGPLSPAFGTPNTIVSMPLNRRLAMVSLIEEEMPSLHLDQQGVAVVNSMTATYANQLYSPQPDFVWLMEDHAVGNVAQLLDSLNGDQS